MLTVSDFDLEAIPQKHLPKALTELPGDQAEEILPAVGIPLKQSKNPLEELVGDQRAELKMWIG